MEIPFCEMTKGKTYFTTLSINIPDSEVSDLD